MESGDAALTKDHELNIKLKFDEEIMTKLLIDMSSTK